MARKIPVLGRMLGAPALFAIVYGEIGSSLYFALGLTSVYALSATPYVFIAAGILFALAAAAYAEGGATISEPGGAASFARRAFNDLVGFFAGWAAALDYVIAIALSALFVPRYLTGAFGHPNALTDRQAALAGVGILAVVTLIRLIRRPNVYAAGILLAILDLVVQITLGGARPPAAVSSQRALQQHQPGRRADVEFARVLVAGGDGGLHRAREGLVADGPGQGSRTHGAGQHPHVGDHRGRDLRRRGHRGGVGVPGAPRSLRSCRLLQPALDHLGEHAHPGPRARHRAAYQLVDRGRSARGGGADGLRDPAARDRDQHQRVSPAWPNRWAGTCSCRPRSAAAAGGSWQRRPRSPPPACSRPGSSWWPRSSRARRRCFWRRSSASASCLRSRSPRRRSSGCASPSRTCRAAS